MSWRAITTFTLSALSRRKIPLGCILTKAAVRAVLRRVEAEIPRDHIAHCVEHAIVSGNTAEQRKKIAELMDVIGRAGR